MGVPTKKIYGRNGKVIFDPSNPEDVRSYKEKQPLMEALKLVQGLTDPRTGGGLTGATRIISRITGAKMAKAKFTQNRANQILELFGKKPTTKGKKVVPKAAKKNTPTVKEVVETKPTIPTTIPTSGSAVSDKIKSLSNAEIKAFENVKNARELAEKQAKNAPTTTIPKSIRDSWEYNNSGLEYYIDGVEGFRKAGTEAKSILSKLKDSEAARNATKKAFEKGNAEVIKKGVEKTNTNAASLGILAGVLGAGAETIAYGMRLSNKDNKKTKTPQKTGPVDLKRITNTKPSNIEGVRTVKGTDGKDYGIVWDNKTQSWDYYRGGGKPVVKQTNPKQEKSGLAIGGGDSKRNDSSGTGSGGKTTTGGGTGTKPRSATGQAFDKAFAEARKQAGGAGGIFEWNGKKYGTALKGETVPKNRVEVGKTTAPVTIKNDYPTAKTDPTLEIAMQQDSIRQQMATKPLPTKPLSSLVFKTTAKAAETQKMRNTMDEQNALRSIIADNRMPLKKKSYGGNLAMLKYMKQ
jgi:hypothetical protein